MFAIAGCSNVGARKNVNQDAWCALAAQTSVGDVALTVVCDGVGGLSNGELASATVVDEFSRWFQVGFPDLASASVARTGTVDLSEVAAVWATMISNLNRRIGDFGRRRNARLGTTFTGMLVCQGRYVIGHVGDCRIYRIAGGDATQITNDQTLAARAVAEGTLTKEEALHKPQGSVLLQSVGTQVEVRPEFTYGEVKPGDLFVTCCDGFYRRLGDEGVRAAYAEVDPSDETALLALTERLIEQDMENGEKDNLTAVCLFVPGGDEETTLLDDAEEGTALLDDADEATTLLDGADEGTTLLQGAGDASESPVAHHPAHDADDATTMLTGDEQTSFLDGGRGGAPWRA